MTMACSQTGWAAASPTRAAATDTFSDDVLIERVANGDQLAMRTLYARHRVMIYRWLLRLVGDQTSAEDLLSDVFLDVWRKAASFEGRSSVSTWIMSIARFKALSVRRRRQEIELDQKVEETVADQYSTPEQILLETDRSAQLRACLSQLSPDHREIIDLVYYHDKTIEEVADIVGVPKNTVKTRMFYARRRLAQLLAQHRDFDHLTAAAV